jgi:hypothetical protein
MKPQSSDSEITQNPISRPSAMKKLVEDWQERIGMI